MRRILAIGLTLAVVASMSAHAATITILNNDGVGEGFNDPTAAAPVGGNPGVTVGQQRLNVFQEAADIWGALLPSAVTIIVRAQFNPQTCGATSAILGSAGPSQVWSDFAGAEIANTWYHVALANKLGGVDLDPALYDINATFNSNLNGNPGCLGGIGWYYGFDGNEGVNIELLPVVLHEMGHGLGFSTLVNSAGVEFGGASARPDLFERFIRDNTLGLTWDNMTQGQRATSAINTNNVVWNGAFVTAHAPLHLDFEPTMFVNSGAGLPASLVVGTATFGTPLDETGVTGNVVLAVDAVAPVNDACTALTNGGAIAGNIALIDRGTCAFTVKAAAAQAAGAIAVVIANNVAGGTPPGLGGVDPSITIPVASVTLADGNAIKAALGGGVNVTLAINPDQLAGADSANRVKLYAPNPYEGGSSISHFDVSATPNLLMEPAINVDLSSDVDLTLPLFTDLGWLDTLPTSVQPVSPRSAILANYPNPFNPSTTIRYELPSASLIELAVYDVQGRLVRTLASGPAAAGPHQTAWNGRDQRGNPVASGVYYLRLAASGETMTRKMVLLK
jgi:hypothetical protein